MADHPYHTDQALLDQIAAGDETAFNLLLDRYWNRIYAVALAYTKSPVVAEDIVQEVFLKLWQKRQTLPVVEKVDNYLFIITRNEVISAMRKKGPALPLGHQLANLLTENGPQPEDRLSLKEIQELIGKGVQQLPAQQQQAWKLSRESGLSHEEIARQMQLSKNTVKNHLVRAISFLRAFLHQHANLLFLFV